jgi:hypothetical protein
MFKVRYKFHLKYLRHKLGTVLWFFARQSPLFFVHSPPKKIKIEFPSTEILMYIWQKLKNKTL